MECVDQLDVPAWPSVCRAVLVPVARSGAKLADQRCAHHRDLLPHQEGERKFAAFMTSCVAAREESSVPVPAWRALDHLCHLIVRTMKTAVQSTKTGIKIDMNEIKAFRRLNFHGELRHQQRERA